MKSYPYGPGSYTVNQLADELVAAGVPMGGEAHILRNGFPIATSITIVTNDNAVDAVVNATVAAHIPSGLDAFDVGLSTATKPSPVAGRTWISSDTGQVFIANGSAWVPATKHVVVASLADFPAPVANVITLPNNHAYLIRGTVDIGINRIVCGVANIIRGVDRSNDKLISSTTGALFTVDGTAGTKTIFTVQDCTVQAASGSFISFTSATPNQALALISMTLSSTATGGTIHNCSSFVVRNSAFTSLTTDGFTFTNSAAAIQIAFRDNVVTNCTGTLLALLTSVWGSVIIGGNRISVSVDQTFISGTTGGANVTVGGKITGNVFFGAGTYVATLTNADALWSWDSNVGIVNTPITIAWADITGEPTTLAGYGITDAASDVELGSHEADTTGVHGIANTANLIIEGDSRLTNARTPSAHVHAAADVTSGVFDPARLGSGATGTKFLRGDSTFQTIVSGGDLLAANNLSDLLSAAAARINLGLGTVATTAITDYATAAQGALATTALQVNAALGAATGTSLTTTGLIKSSGTAGIGYATGAGGTVTQLTNKTTGVTINKTCGQITMNAAALAAGAEVSFTVTNSTVSATDVVVVCIQSVGTVGAYFVTVGAVAAGSFSITVGNCSTGSLSQALVLNFVVIKGVSA